MVHIYTGKGKGKTTAATGLIIRSKGAGLSGTIIRFIKQEDCSEDKILKKLGIIIEYFGTGYISESIKKQDREKAAAGISRCREIILNKNFDIIVADEILIAENLGLIQEEEILKLINITSENIELILTGRNASEKVIERADLVTEMKEVKHYFNHGLESREGIEY